MVESAEIPVETASGHQWSLLARLPRQPKTILLWLPALGVAARHYLPFADALAQRGITVFLHEWRGHGSSNLRATGRCNWGYRELLLEDLPASEAAARAASAGSSRFTIGGHSLGGQLACCRLSLSPSAADALWLVASGSPYWRAFPAPTRWWLPLAYRFLPWLANRRGSLPGRAIGFGGNEARGLIRDWARTGLSGRYAASGIESDLETALKTVTTPVRAITFRDDWLAPDSSLHFLLSKMPESPATSDALDGRRLGTHADHFAWMQQPDAVAESLAE